MVKLFLIKNILKYFFTVFFKTNPKMQFRAVFLDFLFEVEKLLINSDLDLSFLEKIRTFVESWLATKVR
jgi:hypothetical protein